jgi:serine/threonine-protein kinase HipA
MNRLAVHLNGVRVGLLTGEDRWIFAYDPQWVADETAPPLSRQFPIRSEPYVGTSVRAFFSGLLPEAEPRERIAEILGVSPGNDFALLERLGGDCAGAVSLHAEGSSAANNPARKVRRLADAEVGELVEQLKDRPMLAGEDGLRLSLAGAQIKLPVVLTDEAGGLDADIGLPLDGTPSTHILKPEPERFPGLASNEAWCMGLAGRVGLNVARARRRVFGKTPCLVVERYDRERRLDGTVRRLHQEDFCQALGIPTERKYQQEGGPSLRDCMGLLRDWSTAPVLDIRDFLDAVTFAAITGNADAHAKNYSFLYARRERRLAPLYDQVCTLAWAQLSRHLSMKIGTAGSLNEVSPEHFRQLARDARLDWPRLRERLGELCARIREATTQEHSAEGSDTSDLVRLTRERAERMERLVAKPG